MLLSIFLLSSHFSGYADKKNVYFLLSYCFTIIKSFLGWSFHSVLTVDFAFVRYLIQSISSTERMFHFTVLKTRNT